MIRIKEKSLSEALCKAACRELPKKFDEDGETFWLKAIALVRKCDGTQSYCLAEHASNGMLVYTDDFGTMSPIFGLISIHPYTMLDLDRFGYKGADEGFPQFLLSRGLISYEKFMKFKPEDIEVYKIRYAKFEQDRADEAFRTQQRVDEGHDDSLNDDAEVDENGGDGVIIAEDGSKEVFTDISRPKSKDTTPKARKGRKPKK